MEGQDIVVAGGAQVAAKSTEFAVARLNADGSLDASFNGQGRRTEPLAGGYDEATALAIEPGGTILVGGEATLNSYPAGVLVRYTSQGQPDSSLIDYSNRYDLNLTGVDFLPQLGVAPISGLAVANDGWIRATGGSGFLGCNPSGQPVYNGNGLLGAGAVAKAVALAPDNNAYIAGTTADDRFVVARVSRPGFGINPTFGDGGSTTLSFPSSSIAEAGAVAPEDSGAIVAEFIGLLTPIYHDAVANAERLGKQLVAEAKALGRQVAAEAKQLAKQLIAQAKAEGGTVLAEAAAQAKAAAAAALKEAQAKAQQAAAAISSGLQSVAKKLHF